ncbi:hypothetical protein AgCh_038946 [Apium graveolens]
MDDKTTIISSTTDDKPAMVAIVSSTTDDKSAIISSTNGKTAIIPSTTVGPSCFRDDRKQVVKKKSRFPLFRGSRVKARSNSNETTKQNKISNKSKDDKIKHNNVDQSPSPHPSSPSPLSAKHGTLRKFASAGNLQELANMSLSPSVSNDNLQEAEGTMSQSDSPYDLSDHTAPRHKHSVSTGNIPELMTKGGMSYSKSNSNLQDFNKFGMRRYASALNLLDLDINEEVDEEEDGDDKALENCAGDVMIDDKADQFIAQFYQQMKSQHKGRP